MGGRKSMAWWWANTGRRPRIQSARNSDGRIDAREPMTNLPSFVVRTGAHEQKFNGSWYRGKNTRFIPSRPMLSESGAVERYILDGWLPGEPFVTKDMPITAFGSCFAGHITSWLSASGFNVNGANLNNQAHIFRFGEGMVNSFSILEQFRWALENISLEDGLWFGESKEIALPTEEVR